MDVVAGIAKGLPAVRGRGSRGSYDGFDAETSES